MVPKRAAISSITALTSPARRASGRASEAGRRSIRPGSGRRMVRTTAPAPCSAVTTVVTEARSRAGSKPPRRVSLTPTITLARSGRSARARGSWSRSTSPDCAPDAARLWKTGSGSPSASSAAQPRQPRPATGSPMPSVIESPSATNVHFASLAGRRAGGAPAGASPGRAGGTPAGTVGGWSPAPGHRRSRVVPEASQRALRPGPCGTLAGLPEAGRLCLMPPPRPLPGGRRGTPRPIPASRTPPPAAGLPPGARVPASPAPW